MNIGNSSLKYQDLPIDMVLQFLDGIPFAIQASNAKLTNFDSASPCAGFYTGGKQLVPDTQNPYVSYINTNFPDSGIVLSSGTVDGLFNRNTGDCPSTRNAQSYIPGDPDLTKLANWTGNVTNTSDACILEFDFTADCDQVEFDFVFASDEYNTYVFTGQHDVFGFFQNGTNRATVFNGQPYPVDVDSINNSTLQQYFFDNTNGEFPHFRPNGFTTALTATLYVNDVNATNADDKLNQPSDGYDNVTWHFKIGIANTNDNLRQSWVFLKSSSFRCVQLTPPPTPQSTCTYPNSTIPSVPICQKHIKAAEVIGESGISKPPFTVVARNTSTVTFTLDVNWTDYKSVYVQYFDLHQQQYECINLCNKPDNFTITAHCLKTKPIAVIEIWMETGAPGDNANVSSCCSPTTTVSGVTRHYPDSNLFASKHFVEGTYELWCDCEGKVIDGSTQVRKLTSNDVPKAQSNVGLRGISGVKEG